jgi:hypothetical protein
MPVVNSVRHNRLKIAAGEVCVDPADEYRAATGWISYDLVRARCGQSAYSWAPGDCSRDHGLASTGWPGRMPWLTASSVIVPGGRAVLSYGSCSSL